MDVREFLEKIAGQLTQELNATYCTIRIIENDKLKLIAAYGVKTEGRETEIPTSDTIAGEAIKTGQVINTDITQNELYAAQVQPGDPNFLCAIPLVYDEIKVGVAQVYGTKRFTLEQERIAKALGLSAGLSIGYSLRYKIICQRTAEIAELIIQNPLSFQYIPHRMAELIADIVQVQRCIIYQIIDASECEITAGIPAEQHGIGKKSELTKHPDIEFAVQHKNSFLVENPLNDPRTSYIEDIIKLYQINQIFYIVIAPENETIGVIVLDITAPKQRFSEEQIESCNWLGRLITTTMRQQALYQKLRDIVKNRTTTLGARAERLKHEAEIISEEAKKYDQI